MNAWEELCLPYLGGEPFANSRVGFGVNEVDFYIDTSSIRYAWKLKDKLRVEMDKFDLLRDVELTTDYDVAMKLRFFNLSIPIDGKQADRLAVAATVVSGFVVGLYGRG